MKLLIAPLALLLLQAPAPTPGGVTYRFDEVKHSVLRWPGGDEAKAVKAAPGEAAAAGDVVKTGWWGHAVLSVPERSSRFEIYGSTQVRLAGEEPGVLVILDRGRIKAIFDALTGGRAEERRVAVPGALLAVRGTRYGVEVDKHGNATLVVFKGVVEILPQVSHPGTFLVKAGEWSTFGPALMPKIGPMPGRGFGEREWDQGVHMDGSMMGTGTMLPCGTMPGRPPGTGSSGPTH